MIDNDVIEKLYLRLLDDENLTAVIANCVPECIFNRVRFFNANYHRALHLMKEKIGASYFRGMCYIIKLDIANLVNIPKEVVSDDVYLFYKLKGSYIYDWDIRVSYRITHSFANEVARHLGHRLMTLQMRELHKKGFLEPIYKEPVYQSSDRRDIYNVRKERTLLLKAWFELPARLKVYPIIFVLVRIFNLIRGLIIYKSMKSDQEISTRFWK